MITLKEFTAALDWSMLEFEAFQIKDIYNAIITEGYESTDHIRFAIEEGELPDAIFFYDTNLVPALENLSSIHETDLVDLINSHYGESVSIYYLKQDDMYAVIYNMG